MTNEDIEKLKHSNAISLEEIKWQKKKEEISYLEAGQHLRSLNQQLWQVPGMAIAVTGGIWYGAASLSHDLAKTLVLLFACSVDILTIVVLWRLRALIQTQIDVQNKLNSCSITPQNNQKDSLTKKSNSTAKGWIVVTCWSILLISAALLSSIAAFNAERISLKITPPIKSSSDSHTYCQKLVIIIR